MLEEITALSQQDDLTVVLAHVERYLADQPHVLWPQLRRLGILFQCNASFFLDWRYSLQGHQNAKNREIDLLGSDCHGVSYRPPRMGEAAERIRRSAGDVALTRLMDCAREITSVNC